MRARLTIAVALVVGALAITAALLAPRSVEHALIDDRLDAEVATEAATLAGSVAIFSPAGTTIGSRELTALFGPDIAGLTTALEGTGAIEQIRAMRPDGRLLVTPAAGVVGDVGRDGRIRVESRSSQTVDGPIITGTRLEQLAGTLGTPSVFSNPFEIFADAHSFDDFIAELDRRLDGDLGAQLDLGDLPPLSGEVFPRELFDMLERDRSGAIPVPAAPETPRGVGQLTFGVRSVGDLDVIVAAPTDGIDLTVGRVRSALWATVPIAVALTALVTWLLAGRALRPVRAITEQTGRIRSGTLHERVPVPSSHDEIAGLATVMNDMLDRLQREDQRRRQFVADASHELRSPIAAIQTQAEVVLSTATDADSTELADGVLAEATRLGTIVDDLLSIARHDEELAPPGAIIDLDDVVLAAATRARRVPVDTRQVSGGQIRGRPDELARTITHLLDNAARHAASAVRVSLSTTGDRVELAVDDDGPGVAPGDRERVFERFVRLDEARVRDDGGAGLGLAVVQTVVTAAGGSITVTDSDLGGARFVATFPTA